MSEKVFYGHNQSCPEKMKQNKHFLMLGKHNGQIYRKLQKLILDQNLTHSPHFVHVNFP